LQVKSIEKLRIELIANLQTAYGGKLQVMYKLKLQNSKVWFGMCWKIAICK